TSGLYWGGFGVGFITLLGASIALMNIMLVSVTERTREVGVRKALGATPLRIRQQFVIEAIVVCLLGGIAGIVLGILIGNLMASFMEVEHFVVPWLWMVVGLLVCVFVGLISGYYPAHLVGIPPGQLHGSRAFCRPLALGGRRPSRLRVCWSYLGVFSCV